MPKQPQAPVQQRTAPTKAPARPAPKRAHQAGSELLVQRALADPASLSAPEVVQLQRQLGNQTVNDLLTRSPGVATAVAPALTVQRAPTSSLEAEIQQELPEAQGEALAGGGAPDMARPAAPPDDDENIQRRAAPGGAMGLAGGPI